MLGEEGLKGSYQDAEGTVVYSVGPKKTGQAIKNSPHLKGIKKRDREKEEQIAEYELQSCSAKLPRGACRDLS